jgi:hypothetical protein
MDAGQPALPPAAPRRRFRIPLRVEKLGDEEGAPRFLGYAGDLSHTGAFVQCFSPRDIGSVLQVQMHMKGGKSIACHAEVVWTRGYGGRHGPSPGMGIRFLDLDPRIEKRLRSFCRPR